MPRSRLSKAIVSQVGTYVQKLGGNCPKPSRKFLRLMMLGMAISGSVKLSETARKLHSLRSITFHALHKGLCRGLKSKQWGALAAQENYLGQARAVLPSNSIIACDLGDITKPRAKKMPGLRTVRDGSTGKLKKGWWLIEIEAVFEKGKHLPLWLEPFSVGRRGYKSQRAMVEMAISMLVKHLGTLGLWAFDRGFDNWKYFVFLAALKLKFLIRVKANRIVVDMKDQKRKSLGKAAQELNPEEKFVWGRKRTRTGYVIRVGFGQIEIPQSGQKLWLIAAWGFGRHPLLLMSNASTMDAATAVKMVKNYLKRWGVEEAGRLVKQMFKLEDIRVLSWAGLVKLTWITMWTYGLLCMMRLKAKRLYEGILAMYPSFGRVPRYPYYRIAGGLALLLLLGVLTDPTIFSELWESG